MSENWLNTTSASALHRFFFDRSVSNICWQIASSQLSLGALPVATNLK